MGRKSKKKKKKKKSANRQSAKPKKKSPAPATPAVNPEALEAPNAVAGTVAWLLSAFATVLGLLAAGIAWLVYTRNAERETFGAVHLFLFAATITGIVTLVLTVLVRRIRKRPPPTNVTRGAIVIGILPLVVQAVVAIVNR